MISPYALIPHGTTLILVELLLSLPLTDPEDGTIPPASITTTGTVNTAVLGTYTITYSATDSGGLTTKQARTVAVLPPGNLQPTEAEVTDYYPYGSQRIHTGPFTEQKKFTGYEYDADAGISYAQARYYSQDVGRFASQDPSFWEPEKLIFDPQLQNSYSYARDNPLNTTDPDGKDPVSYGQKLFTVAAQAPVNILNGVANTALTALYGAASIFSTSARTQFNARGQAQADSMIKTYNAIASYSSASQDAREEIAAKVGVYGAIIVMTGGAVKYPGANVSGRSAYTVSEHAIQRMQERGVSLPQVEAIMQNSKPFQYVLDGTIRNGYYNPQTKLFIGQSTATGKITTVITNASQNYIRNLQNKN
jgi:RHS repeat-associated protein